MISGLLLFPDNPRVEQLRVASVVDVYRTGDALNEALFPGAHIGAVFKSPAHIAAIKRIAVKDYVPHTIATVQHIAHDNGLHRTDYSASSDFHVLIGERLAIDKKVQCSHFASRDRADQAERECGNDSARQSLHNNPHQYSNWQWRQPYAMASGRGSGAS